MVLDIHNDEVCAYLFAKSRAFLHLVMFLCLFSACKQKPIKDETLENKTVEIREHDGRFQLYRNGTPYFIKGAGGYEHFEEIRDMGGNSIRIWSTENAKDILDRAHELGLTVTVGLKVAYAKSELNYSDKRSVSAQQEKLKEEVLKYKDHPALLMWGIGNEPTLNLHPLSILEHNRTWNAINNVAKMVHEVDPNHPTTTMLQDIPGKTVFYISKFCKEIDIISVNIFRNTGDTRVADLLESYGWKGPFLISEYGTLGYWAEEKHTGWYAFNEKTSTQKSRFIEEFYQEQVVNDDGRCIGSYVFYWGQKHEYTSTWLSLFTESGQKTEMTDRIQYLWTNKWPSNRAPSIHSLEINQPPVTEEAYLSAGKNFTAVASAYDYEEGNLTLEWEVVKDETERHFNATYNQEKPEVVANGILVSNEMEDESRIRSCCQKCIFKINLQTPESEGPYRLFVYVRDEFGKVATANTAFYVIKRL